MKDMGDIQNCELSDPLFLFGVSLATPADRTMLFVLIDYDESRRNAQYCAKVVLQMIELMRIRYKNITEGRSDHTDYNKEGFNR